MELLNISPQPILPTTMWLVFRVLGATRELTRDELIDAVCPPAMIAGTPGDGAHVKRAIDALRTFGLVENAEGDLLRAAERLDLAAFRRKLRGRLLSANDRSELLAEDLVRGLEWLVRQSPNVAYEYPSSGVFVNDTRFNTFNYWAPFLGFARDWPLAEGERSVDPTAAVEDAIFHPGGAGPRDGSMEIAVLLQHIEAEIPILRSTNLDGVTTVLPSTAFALRSLVVQGKLRLERAADARNVVRLPAGAGAKNEDFFSHATVLRDES